jgi:hypothetical protein
MKNNRPNETSTRKKSENGQYGIDAETSLQSVNFATTENPYLNEHFQEEAEND